MKLTTKILILALLQIAIVGCCDKDKGGGMEQHPLVLKGKVYSFDSDNSVVWVSSQAIGVYAKNGGTTTIIGDYSNYKHIADYKSTTGYFVPSGEPIRMPIDGSKIDISAYYPYEEGKGDIHTFDIGDQSKVNVSAFLFADNVKGLDNSSNVGELQLKPVLSRVRYHLFYTDDMATEAQQATLGMENVPTQGTLNLLNGEMSNYSATQGISLKIKEDLADAILLPGEVGEQNVVLKTSQKTYQSALKDILDTYQSNVQYDIAIYLSKNGIRCKLIGKTYIFIDEWSDDMGEEGSVKPYEKEYVVGGNMEYLTNDDIVIGTQVPKQSDQWFAIKNNVTGDISVEKDAVQGNVLHMTYDGSLSWYKNHIGYTSANATSAAYRLTFKAKASAETNMQVYVRVNTSTNQFFVLNGADTSKACAASMIGLTPTWKEYTVDFDFSQYVNTIYSSGISVEASTEKELKAFFLAFVATQAKVHYYLDDVSLKKINNKQ